MILSFVLAFLIKFVFVVSVAVIFYGKRQRIAESLVCGWLVAYEGLISLMLILSCFKMMNKTGIMIGGGCLILAIILYAGVRKTQCFIAYFHDFWNKIRHGDYMSHIMVNGFLLLSVYIIGHNLLFCDSTWDAYTYQIPRIELFVQKETLFVNMCSDAVNIFSNEWNGELNSVFYAIICGTNQGMFLANAENFIYSLLVVYWFCKKIGIESKNVLLAMTWYCSMPVVIFLTMVVKGDFIVISFFLTSIIWLKEYIETQDEYSLFFLIIGGALAAGSKISMIPFFGLCFVSVLIFLVVENQGKIADVLRYVVSIWKTLLLSIVCACISCSRYLLNLLYFGQLFKRVESANEKIAVSWQHLQTSVAEMAKTLVECDNMFTYEGAVYALGMDMGLVGSLFEILFLPVTVVWLLRDQNRVIRRNKSIFYVWLPIVGSLLFFLSSTMWFPWSFRYYIPWMLVLFFFWVLMLQEIFSITPDIVKKIAFSSGIWLGIISVASTIVLTTKFGEVTHSTWKEAKLKPMIEREYGFYNYLLERGDGAPDIYDFFDQIKSGRNVLICNGGDTAISFLFGEDNSNDVTLCIPEEVISMLSDKGYDVVSISDFFLTPEIEEYFENGEWVCYMPEAIRAHIYIHNK